MTREEALAYAISQKAGLESELHRTPCGYGNWAVYSTVLDFINAAISALKGPTREQVEKVFPGCDFCNLADFGEFGFEITKHYAKICCALGSWRFPQNEQFLFCPKCGKPLTDEAVDMVMERLEALHGEKESD